MQRLDIALGRHLRVLPLHVHGVRRHPMNRARAVLHTFMAAAKDAPDLGAYTAHAVPGDSDDEVFTELDREVEALNEADADDAAQVVGGSGRGADGDLAAAFQEYRQQRLAEIQAQYVGTTYDSIAARSGADRSDPDRGQYRDVKDEKELLSRSVREPRCVIHFAKKEFRRCQILDRHLEVRARANTAPRATAPCNAIPTYGSRECAFSRGEARHPCAAMRDGLCAGHLQGPPHWL